MLGQLTRQAEALGEVAAKEEEEFDAAAVDDMLRLKTGELVLQVTLPLFTLCSLTCFI